MPKSLKPHDTRKLMGKDAYTRKRRAKDKITDTDDQNKDIIMEFYLNYLDEINDPQYKSELAGFHDFANIHGDANERKRYVQSNITPKYIKRLCTDMEKQAFCEKIPQKDMDMLTDYLLTHFEDDQSHVIETEKMEHRVLRP